MNKNYSAVPKLLISLIVSVGVLVLFACQRIANMPRSEAVADAVPLPIDGTWKWEGQNATVKIQNGKMYTLDENFWLPSNNFYYKYPSGTVIAYSFRQLSATQFACEWPTLDPSGNPAAVKPIPIDLTTPRSLTFHLAKLVTGFLELELVRAESSGDVHSADTFNILTDRKPAVQMEAKRLRRAISTEYITIPAGSTIEIARTRTLEREVTLEVDSELQAELSVDAVGLLKESIRSEIGAKSGQVQKETEERNYSIRLDGNTAQKYKLVWYEVVLPGKISFDSSDGVRTIPFRFREAEEFEAVAVP